MNLALPRTQRWVLGQYGAPLLPSRLAEHADISASVSVVRTSCGTTASPDRVSIADLIDGSVWSTVSDLDALRTAAWALLDVMTTVNLGALTLGDVMHSGRLPELPLLSVTREWLAHRSGPAAFDVPLINLVVDEADALPLADILVTGEGWRTGATLVSPGTPIQRLGSELLVEYSTILGLKEPAAHQRDALLAYWVWSGSEPVTLEVAGQRVALTRERVRQLAKQYSSPVLERNWPLPSALHALLDRLAEVAPAPESDVQLLMEDEGWLPAGFSIASALELAHGLGRSGRVKVTDGYVVPIINGVPITPGELQSAVWKASGKLGIVHIEAVVLKLASDGIDCPSEQLLSWLGSVPGVLRIGTDHAFTESGKAGTLIQAALRQLAVSSPLSSEELLEGLVRRTKFRQLPSPPAASVMLELYRVHEAFIVSDDDQVTPNPSYEWTDDPTTLQRRLVEIMRAHRGSIASDVEIYDESDRQGLKRASVMAYLQYGEQIRRIAPNTYAPVGHVPDEDVLEEVLLDRSLMAVKSRVSHRYDGKTGEHVLTAQLGTASTHTGVINVPSAVTSLIPQRRYRLNGARLGFRGPSLYGLVSAFNQELARPGELVEIRLDPSSGTATLTWLDR